MKTGRQKGRQKGRQDNIDIDIIFIFTLRILFLRTDSFFLALVPKYILIFVVDADGPRDKAAAAAVVVVVAEVVAEVVRRGPAAATEEEEEEEEEEEDGLASVAVPVFLDSGADTINFLLDFIMPYTEEEDETDQTTTKA